MHTITRLDMEQLITMDEAIEGVKMALSLYSSKQCTVPLRTSLTVTDGLILYMPAFIESINALGTKVVSIFPNNKNTGKPVVAANMLLNDATTGELVAMMDGTYLTELRTGALQGAATSVLANKDAKIAVLFGIGGQAQKQLEGLLAARDLKEIRVVSTNFERTEAFVRRINSVISVGNTKIIAAKNGNDAIKGADIITTATSSTTPVFDGSFVKPGTHINGIGSFTPNMQELPASIICKPNKIYFDTAEGVLTEAGDIITPLNNRTIHRDDFKGELGTVLLEGIDGRTSADEITIFKSVGSAVFDLVIAHLIYEKYTMQHEHVARPTF